MVTEMSAQLCTGRYGTTQLCMQVKADSADVMLYCNLTSLAGSCQHMYVTLSNIGFSFAICNETCMINPCVDNGKGVDRLVW
jgi:hypothetical protein